MEEHKAGNHCCSQQYKILQLNPVKVTEVLQTGGGGSGDFSSCCHEYLGSAQRLSKRRNLHDRGEEAEKSRVGLESPNSVFSSWNKALHKQWDPLAILRALFLLYLR